VDISIHFGEKFAKEQVRNSLEVLKELSIQERVIPLDIVLTLNEIRHRSPLTLW
jgi:hypothetical protein